MSAKFLTVWALMAFGSTSWSQQTSNPNVHGANSFVSSTTTTDAPPAHAIAINGRTLFLRNCAHCHGATAHGDDGPDLHDLGLTDDWIANRIRKGKTGQMTAFAGKLQPAEIAARVAYVQTLK